MLEYWNDGKNEGRLLEGHAPGRLSLGVGGSSWPDATKRVPPDGLRRIISVLHHSIIPQLFPSWVVGQQLATIYSRNAVAFKWLKCHSYSYPKRRVVQ